MRRVLIDERLPVDPLEAEVVLHVRHHLRQSIKTGRGTAAHDLAMLFGKPRARGDDPEWREAASSATPLAAAAHLAAGERGAVVTALGHDNDHLDECRTWLLGRKESEDAFRPIIASDLATLLTLSRARDLARASARDASGVKRHLPIVITGETGTGKELLAKAMHVIWARGAGGPKAEFHPLHLAGMPANLIYDELFGHTEGAFTGARRSREGRLVRADKGTLLIDEVGDLPPEAQVALLRFLQDGSLSAIGRDDARNVDVRIIAATWHDLAEDVEKHRFRADLYHRLHAGSALRLEPLRDRRMPFRTIVGALVTRKQHEARPPISHSALEALSLCRWPGNLRELDGVLDEAISMSGGATVRLEHLPSQIVRRYLALPIHLRARGFLTDDAEDGAVTPELVEWRIARASESVVAQAVAPGATETRRLAAFLQQLDDPAPEHAAALDDAKEAVRLEDELIHTQTLERMLEGLAGDADVPEVAVEVVRKALADARERQAGLRTGVIECVRRIDASHPWLRVYRDVAALPILQGKANTEVAQGIILFVRTFVSFWPAGLALLRAKAVETGAAGVLATIKEMLPADTEAKADVGDKRLCDRKVSQNVTKDEWIDVVRSNKSLGEAKDATGFDTRTIKKWLREHGVAPRWGEAHSAGVAAVPSAEHDRASRVVSGGPSDAESERMPARGRAQAAGTPASSE